MCRCEVGNSHAEIKEYSSERKEALMYWRWRDTPKGQQAFRESVLAASRATNKLIDEIASEMAREIGKKVDELARERMIKE